MTMGLYGNGMHDFVMHELEVGRRVAMAQDSETCGWSALDELRRRVAALPIAHTCKPCKCETFDQEHCRHSHDPWFGADRVVLIDDVDVDKEVL